MDKDSVLERITTQLDTLVNLFKIVYADKIDEVRSKVLADKTMAKILEVVENELPANELVSKVCSDTNQKDRAVRYRLSSLVGMGILRVEKIGNKSFYRLTGVI